MTAPVSGPSQSQAQNNARMVATENIKNQMVSSISKALQEAAKPAKKSQ